MNISETCIRRPVLTTLMTASLIVFGAFAYRLLPVAALPAVDFPTIQITAQLPGAAPETMAASVAAPIERQLSTIAGISSMNSSSALGLTQITIQFDLGRNIDGAALDVQTALSTAAKNLPVEMTTPPSFRKVNPGDFPVLYLSMRSDTMPLSAIDDYAETVLAPQISQLPGIAQVLVYGAQKFAVRVQVDPIAAAARNISLDDIRKVVANANSSAPVGTLFGPNQNVTLLATGAIQAVAEPRRQLQLERTEHRQRKHHEHRREGAQQPRVLQGRLQVGTGDPGGHAERGVGQRHRQNVGHRQGERTPRGRLSANDQAGNDRDHRQRARREREQQPHAEEHRDRREQAGIGEAAGEALVLAGNGRRRGGLPDRARDG